MKTSEFDWDDGNCAKCEQHGVSLAEIEALFTGDPLIAPDFAHSIREERFVAVGRTGAGRAIFVAFTWREKNKRTMIRPISARFMHQRESDAYGQENPKVDDR